MQFAATTRKNWRIGQFNAGRSWVLAAIVVVACPHGERSHTDSGPLGKLAVRNSWWACRRLPTLREELHVTGTQSVIAAENCDVQFSISWRKHT